MLHHNGDEDYSFHLNHVDKESTYSNQPPTSTASSLNKQRIDTLFRSKRRANQRRQQLNNSIRNRQSTITSTTKLSETSHSINESKHKVLIHNSVTDSLTTQSEQNSANNFSSSVSIKQTPSTILNVNSNTNPTVTISNENSNGDNTHKIRIKQQIHQRNSAQEELAQAFGGKTLRQKSFRENRTAVQAQIERLFADATRENTIRNQKIEVPAPPPPPPRPSEPPPPPRVPERIALPRSSNPPPPRSSEPPPPPSLKTHPAFRNSPAPNSPPSLKRNTHSPHSSGSNSNCSTVSRTSTAKSSNSSGSHSTNMVYRVDYLGAIQLSSKATSLDVLQDPLKHLYYKHRHNVTSGWRVPLSTLSITDAGLRVMKNTSIREELDFINPFASIAVWAAIKMVIKKKINNSGQVSYTYAFLPLICDPDVQEKFNTYYPLNVADPTIMDTTHPPMFACVMRKNGESHVLECHGFICRSSEDAIVIAANLYQALLGTMGPDTCNTSNTSMEDTDGVMSDSEIIPKPPPRRRRTPPSSVRGTLRRSSSEDMLRTSASLEICSNRLRRSTRKRHNIIEEEPEPIEINRFHGLPRSKSVANVPQIIEAQNLFGDPRRKIGLGSIDDVLKTVINPNGMSFSEMDPQHRELLMKMALIMTKDEIYKRSKNIMRSQKSRNGTFVNGFESDSDASTISSVLKATKRSISRIGSRATNSLRPSYFKERMPLKKFDSQGGYLGSQTNLKDTSTKVIEYNHMMDNGSLTRKAPKTPMPKRNPSINQGAASSIYSECDNDSECSSKCYCTLPIHNGNKNGSSSCTNNCSQSSPEKKKRRCDCESESCAESERCYCSLKRIKKNGLKMYEINLDSETDTTVTNSTVKRNRSKSSSQYDSQSNVSDSESRSSTWKRGNLRSRLDNNVTSFTTDRSRSKSTGTVFSAQPEVIRRQKSISPSVNSIAERNHLIRSSIKLRHNSTNAVNRNRAVSTESLMQQSMRYRRPSGSLGSHGSSDSSRSSPGLDSHHSDGSSGGDSSTSTSQQKMLLLSAVDPSGNVVFRGASQKKRRESADTASILSIKKTAEIAALFSELKLDQKTDLINRLQEQVNVASGGSEDEEHYEIMQGNAHSFMFSDNIENSLGYLP